MKIQFLRSFGAFQPDQIVDDLPDGVASNLVRVSVARALEAAPEAPVSKDKPYKGSATKTAVQK